MAMYIALNAGMRKTVDLSHVRALRVVWLGHRIVFTRQIRVTPGQVTWLKISLGCFVSF
jgi:hypothetical protein